MPAICSLKNSCHHGSSGFIAIYQVTGHRVRDLTIRIVSCYILQKLFLYWYRFRAW
jgi:hypothetical protein